MADEGGADEDVAVAVEDVAVAVELDDEGRGPAVVGRVEVGGATVGRAFGGGAWKIS